MFNNGERHQKAELAFRGSEPRHESASFVTYERISLSIEELFEGDETPSIYSWVGLLLPAMYYVVNHTQCP